MPCTPRVNRAAGPCPWTRTPPADTRGRGSGRQVAGAEDVGGYRAVHLNFGERRHALGGDVEDHVGLHLGDELVGQPAVPEVAPQVLRAGLPGPAVRDTPAEADQAAWLPRRELGHERRAYAPGPAGHHDGRAVQPLGEVRFWQAELALPDVEEPRVLSDGRRPRGDERSGQIAQRGGLGIIKTRPARGNRARHRLNKFRDPTQSGSPPAT
jgi:hypothetical protein